MASKTVIVIAGPTASGKTALAIQLAQELNTAIISADSRQCYRELDIGVARPSPEELETVPHYFIASHSIHEKVDAAVFEAYALEKAHAVFQTHDVLILAGGTGLYLDAFCEGLDLIPEVPAVIRQEVRFSYQQHGLSWLKAEVEKLDPLFYARGEVENPHRMMRALEVFKATGHSILHFRKGIKAERPFAVRKFYLQLSKEELHRNIHHRVDRMVENGLLREVETLIPYQHLKALQTVGYKEMFDHLNGELPLPDAIAAMKKNTRLYAKRQLTWFRRDADAQWVAPEAKLLLSQLKS